MLSDGTDQINEIIGAPSGPCRGTKGEVVVIFSKKCACGVRTYQGRVLRFRAECAIGGCGRWATWSGMKTTLRGNDRKAWGRISKPKGVGRSRVGLGVGQNMLTHLWQTSQIHVLDFVNKNINVHKRMKISTFNDLSKYKLL